ncbi:MAG: DUF4190 domain-containing protein [Canibacter sp.]
MSNIEPPNENPADNGSGNNPGYGDADSPTTRLPETAHSGPEGNDDPTTRMPQTAGPDAPNAGQPYDVNAAGGPGQPPVPPAYQQPGAPGAPGPNAPMNTLSVVGFILAFIVGPVGAILSHISLSQIKKRFERGRGLAIAGIIIGWVATAIWLISIVTIIIFGVVAANQVSTAMEELESSQSAPQTPGDDDELGTPADPGDENATGPDSSDAAEGEAPSPEFCSALEEAGSVDISDEAAVADVYKKLADERGAHPNQQVYGDAYDAINAKDQDKLLGIQEDLQNAVMDDSMACASTN